jgi:hypothetical protein
MTVIGEEIVNCRTTFQLYISIQYSCLKAIVARREVCPFPTSVYSPTAGSCTCPFIKFKSRLISNTISYLLHDSYRGRNSELQVLGYIKVYNCHVVRGSVSAT